jgi:hypothetical protein
MARRRVGGHQQLAPVSRCSAPTTSRWQLAKDHRAGHPRFREAARVYNQRLLDFVRAVAPCRPQRKVDQPALGSRLE